MEKNTFFDGITFDYFGMREKSTAGTDAHPPFYGLQYIHAGCLDLRIDNGETYHLDGPFAFLTYPESRFAYSSPPGTARKQYYVCFSGERVKRYVASGLLSLTGSRPYVKIRSAEHFLSDMLELILMLQNPEKYCYAVAKLELLLLSLQDQKMTENAAGFHRKAIGILAQKIMMSPTNDWDFSGEARAMNICPKHFLRLFKEIHGVPPHNFLLRQRLFRAAEMLIREKMPVKAVAYECGFKNEFYFSYLFKKYFSVSPGIYRNKCEYTVGSYIPEPK